MNLAALSRFRAYAPLVLRLAFGFQLVKVSYLNVLFPGQHMPEFINYLTTLGFSWPTPGAYLAAYTEFLGGILLLLGLWTRWAALFLIINFTMAFFMAHIVTHDTYQNTMPSTNLLAVSIFLLINGPGKPSVDEGV